MIYKEHLTLAMDCLNLDPLVRFVGYNTAKGPRMNGTLNHIDPMFCIETPVAENLMIGIAMGLALEGYHPVLCFERANFMLVCADALVNGISGLSYYGAKFPMIIRVCVGNSLPLNPGIQHTGDYASLFSGRIPVHKLRYKDDIEYYYSTFPNEPVILLEYKELYND